MFLQAIPLQRNQTDRRAKGIVKFIQSGISLKAIWKPNPIGNKMKSATTKKVESTLKILSFLPFCVITKSPTCLSQIEYIGSKSPKYKNVL